jgi:hypothetical protein
MRREAGRLGGLLDAYAGVHTGVPEQDAQDLSAYGSRICLLHRLAPIAFHLLPNLINVSRAFNSRGSFYPLC